MKSEEDIKKLYEEMLKHEHIMSVKQLLQYKNDIIKDLDILEEQITKKKLYECEQKIMFFDKYIHKSNIKYEFEYKKRNISKAKELYLYIPILRFIDNRLSTCDILATLDVIDSDNTNPYTIKRLEKNKKKQANKRKR